VIELRGELGLAIDSRQTLGVLREALGQDFESDVSP
jgi:hypothetical protein